MDNWNWKVKSFAIFGRIYIYFLKPLLLESPVRGSILLLSPPPPIVCMFISAGCFSGTTNKEDKLSLWVLQSNDSSDSLYIRRLLQKINWTKLGISECLEPVPVLAPSPPTNLQSVHICLQNCLFPHDPLHWAEFCRLYPETEATGLLRDPYFLLILQNACHLPLCSHSPWLYPHCSIWHTCG